MFLPIQLTFAFAFLFYIGAIVVHVFVIKKRIPYTYVNGGRSQTFEDQLKQSQVSILILIIGLVYVFIGLLFPEVRKSIIYMILSSLLAFLWFVGLILQLIGTKFERYLISWLNLIGTIAHIELALQYFVDPE